MLQRELNAVIVLILAGVIAAAYGVQFFWHEEPCPLCLLQRIGMLSVAVGGLMNIKFNIRMSHYGLMLLSSLFGGFVALRQISLHVCPGFSTFGLPVLGLSLYTWSFVVFVCCIAAVSILLLLYDPKQDRVENSEMTALGKSAFYIIFFLAIANALTTYWQCGFGICEG